MYSERVEVILFFSYMLIYSNLLFFATLAAQIQCYSLACTYTLLLWHENYISLCNICCCCRRVITTIRAAPTVVRSFVFFPFWLSAYRNAIRQMDSMSSGRAGLVRCSGPCCAISCWCWGEPIRDFLNELMNTFTFPNDVHMNNLFRLSTLTSIGCRA